MQRITKLKDETDKKGRGLWSTITSAVSDAFAGVTGRRQAESKRKKVAAAGAAGAATAAGAAGVLLAKKKSRDAGAEREAAYETPQPAAGPTSANGSAGEPVSSSSDPSA